MEDPSTIRTTILRPPSYEESVNSPTRNTTSEHDQQHHGTNSTAVLNETSRQSRSVRHHESPSREEILPRRARIHQRSHSLTHQGRQRDHHVRNGLNSRSRTRRRANPQSRIVNIVNLTRYIGTLVCIGCGSIVVGAMFYSQSGSGVQGHGMRLTGTLLIVLGVLVFSAGTLPAVFSCCLAMKSKDRREEEAEDEDEGIYYIDLSRLPSTPHDFDLAEVGEVNLAFSNSPVEELPPPYFRVIEPPPEYPGNPLAHTHH